MKLYIHIGARKTGTTTVQRIFKGNAQLLLANGLFVSTKFQKEEDRIFSKELRKAPENLEKCKEWIADAKASGCENALISSEALSDFVPKEISLLHDLVKEHFSEIEIIFYIRRQDIVATSHYSTALQGGASGDHLMSTRVGGRGVRSFHYNDVVNSWADVFGKNAINIRVFRDPRPKDWGTVGDFLSIIGMPEIEDKLVHQGDRNTRLSAAQAAYLRHFNMSLSPDERKKIPRIHAKFVEYIGDLGGAPLPKPARDIAEEFYGRFRDGNEDLRKTYLSHLPAPLFEEKFDTYPEDQANIDTFFDQNDFEQKSAEFREKFLA